MRNTIFITIFEGVEAKNILRTPILDTLLAEKDIRIVLLAKSLERVAYYKAEFSDPRLIYEVIGQRALRGLDAFFAKAKFMLLRSPSTDMKRRLLRQEKGQMFFYAGLFFKIIFARPFFRRVARMLDYMCVRTHTYDALFNKYQPSLVFMAHLFDEPEVTLLREAKRRGIRTIGFINSWDKVTSRAMLRLLPDRFVVFNSVVRDELVRYNEVSFEQIFVGGLPQYDQFVQEGGGKGEQFFARTGISPEKKVLLYASMGRAFSESDWEMIDLLQTMISQELFGAHVVLFVRFQPNDPLDMGELEKRPGLYFEYPGVRFGSTRGVDWDMSKKDISNLKETLQAMSVLVCYASSLAIDAAFLDKPIVNINFEIKTPSSPLKSPIQYYESDHYKKALAMGAIPLASSKEDLVRIVRAYLENPALLREERARLVQQQCEYKDGKSGERIARFLLSYMYHGV